MFLEKIELVSFRNYIRLSVQPHRELNFITGRNARGKTNFLEAVFFAGSGASFRHNDRNMIRWGEDYARVEAVFGLTGGVVTVKAEIQSEGGKKLLVDGAGGGRRQLPGRFGIVLFRPDDLQIIKGSPSQRRDFIDNDLGLIEPLYRDALTKYRRVLFQRNNLLRTVRENSVGAMQVWNEQFYRYGAQLLLMRMRLLKKFFPLVCQSYLDIAGDGEKIEMKYLSTVKLSGEKAVEQIIKDFAAEGKAREREELYKKQTVVGPHRDDMVFYLDGKDVRQFGSQGQIRSLVLALKAAQMHMFHRETGEQPILLLDDVLMELDAARQQYLMHNIIGGGRQTFVTSATGIENFCRQKGKIYLVDGYGMKEV
ncbi:MAG: DNA replication/repair protein RecF [Firmicutes bacterium]|nr:DNA replication/repair protein RecF [Bacillota bacterium]